MYRGNFHIEDKGEQVISKLKLVRKIIPFKIIQYEKKVYFLIRTLAKKVPTT